MPVFNDENLHVEPITADKNWGNLGYFNLKKVPKLDNFRVKFVNISGEKGRFGCLLRS